MGEARSSPKELGHWFALLKRPFVCGNETDLSLDWAKPAPLFDRDHYGADLGEGKQFKSAKCTRGHSPDVDGAG